MDENLQELAAILEKSPSSMDDGFPITTSIEFLLQLTFPSLYTSVPPEIHMKLGWNHIQMAVRYRKGQLMAAPPSTREYHQPRSSTGGVSCKCSDKVVAGLPEHL